MKRQIILFLFMTISLSSIGQISCTATSTAAHCGHADGTLTVTTTDSCPTGFTYLWNTIPPKTTATVTGLPPGTFTVTVTCDTQTCIASTTVTNLPGPSVSITSVTNSACNRSNGGATATGSGGTPPYTYNWSNGQSGQNLINVIAGTYYVTLTDSEPDDDPGWTSVVITDAPGPSCRICKIQNDTNGLGIGSITACPVGGTPPYYYIWNTVPYPQNTQTATNLQEGTYCLTITDSNGCNCDTCIVVKGPAIIKELKEGNSISIFPNPITNNFTIENLQQAAVIEIINIQGQLIKTFTATGNKTNIDVSLFPSGVYIVEVKTEKGVEIKKFIKE